MLMNVYMPVSSMSIRCGAVSGLHIVTVSSDGEFDGTNLEAVNGRQNMAVSSLSSHTSQHIGAVNGL